MGKSWAGTGLRLLPRGWRADLLDHVTTTRPTWNLNNASTWRRWIFAANGMEAEMQYGGADRALGSRLENLGLEENGLASGPFFSTWTTTGPTRPRSPFQETRESGPGLWKEGRPEPGTVCTN